MSDNTQKNASERAQEILEEAARREKAEKIVNDNPDMGLEGTLAGKIKEQIELARTIKKVFNIASSAIDTAMDYLGPVGRMARTLGGWTKSVLEYSMFERENGDFKRDEHGDRIFSGKRLGKAFALAACMGLSLNLGYHYAYYHGTQFNEMIYTTGKQEIRDGELYHVTGCTSLPCSTAADNGKYYQITKSFFWPRQLYPEENVYASVPQQIAACEIQGYGIYFKELKILHKMLEWYQNIESVSCRPLSEKEIQNMMVTGSATGTMQQMIAPSQHQPASP